jgi:hypothetical protein
MSSACNDGDDSERNEYGQCEGEQAFPNNSCESGELDAYTECANNACADDFDVCKSVCEEWIDCLRDCSCDEEGSACETACGSPSEACTSCFQEAASCSEGCEVPACATGEVGGGNATCEDLTTCCLQLTGDEQSGCAEIAEGDDDDNCAAALETFQSTGSCD